MTIEYTSGTVIGPICPPFRCEFWTKCKPNDAEYKIAGSHYFNDLVEAEDWIRENYARLKEVYSTMSQFWGEIEMRSWDMRESIG